MRAVARRGLAGFFALWVLVRSFGEISSVLARRVKGDEEPWAEMNFAGATK
jgi:hypothetical protein